MIRAGRRRLWIAIFSFPMFSSAFIRLSLDVPRRFAFAVNSGRILSAFSASNSTTADDSQDPIAEHSTTGYVHHVRLRKHVKPLSLVSVVDSVLQERREKGLDVTELSGRELVELGSVWYLPADAPEDPALGVKPTRVNSTNSTFQPGDYMRIHFQPRRFSEVHKYDWARCVDDSSTDRTCKPGVIVDSSEDKGWMVIDKPNHVPVHMTVDNSGENVAECIRVARRSELGGSGEIYVSTPQRLDQNTSGLVVVATSKPFAAYFAALLRNKTAHQLSLTDRSDGRDSGSIHKKYRCLVCLQSREGEDSNTTVMAGLEKLRSYSQNELIMRHYLEPSVRAPKTFVRKPPENSTDVNWPECLLRIKKVGRVAPLVGSLAGQDLSEALWQDDSGVARRIPPAVQAVAEIEVELLTGRTHQIRGQLSTSGFPLVGDALYGGAVPMNPSEKDYYYGTERLALQCCELEFIDPDFKKDAMVRSRRWNRFNLKKAWWTPLLDEFDTVLAKEEASALSSESDSNTVEPARPDLLPARVTLSPGRNKYVLIKATHPGDPQVQWFVKSASPSECGGPYHGNVAQEPRLWIEAANYTATVTGGGRIDYRPGERKACVYGFSYGFGRGDHVFAAELINEHFERVDATYDLSHDLY